MHRFLYFYNVNAILSPYPRPAWGPPHHTISYKMSNNITSSLNSNASCDNIYIHVSFTCTMSMQLSHPIKGPCGGHLIIPYHTT